MIRKLLVGAGLFAAGYFAGAAAGYRGAVIDYVENDAGELSEMADSLYPSRTAESKEREIPDEISELIAEAERQQEQDDDGGTRAFQ